MPFQGRDSSTGVPSGEVVGSVAVGVAASVVAGAVVAGGGVVAGAEADGGAVRGALCLFGAFSSQPAMKTRMAVMTQRPNSQPVLPCFCELAATIAPFAPFGGSIPRLSDTNSGRANRGFVGLRRQFLSAANGFASCI